jgi:hypothetical protein
MDFIGGRVATGVGPSQRGGAICERSERTKEGIEKQQMIVRLVPLCLNFPNFWVR